MEITIASRFCGPKNSGNGGYSCGRLAQLAGGTPEVTLRAPPPLDTPLDIRTDGGKTFLMNGAQLVAEAVQAQLELDVPAAPAWEEAHDAQRAFAGHAHHEFPYCFTCGTARTPDDGLCVHTGPAGAAGLVAATWTPHASLVENGRVREEFLWAATDCAGAWATGAGAGLRTLLGRFTARFDRSVRAAERCIVIGWPLGNEGRKHHAGTALYSADGELIGRGRQTWIEVRPR